MLNSPVMLNESKDPTQRMRIPVSELRATSNTIRRINGKSTVSDKIDEKSAFSNHPS